jgi:pimeloyl-ACP methyl ester carboxylesterase
VREPEYATSSDGTAIAYQTIGLGPGLVVLPGAVLHPDAYKKLAKTLGRSFAVHVVHRRGRGLSGQQGSNYSIERECDDVISVLDATQSHRLFGHSFGALVAVETARSRHCRGVWRSVVDSTVCRRVWRSAQTGC